MKKRLIAKGQNGTSLIMPIVSLMHKFGDVNNVRRQLYKNLNPRGYYKPIRRVFNAVVLDKDEHPEMLNSDEEVMDQLWAEYLQIPEDQRRKVHPFNKITRNDDGSITVPNWASTPAFVVNERDKIGNSSYNHILGRYAANKDSLEFHGSNYYDTYDINPFTKNQLKMYTKSQNPILRLLLGNRDDVSFGIGKPFKIKGYHRGINQQTTDDLMNDFKHDALNVIADFKTNKETNYTPEDTLRMHKLIYGE